jgi:RNA ligase
MATIDIDAYREREAQGLITCRTHPTHDLLIWNYTPQCQFQQAWDEITIQSRGLITKSDGTIIARPFKKFHNLEQHEGYLPLEPFKVTEKMDGSLGILYFADGKPYIATRGSFTSEQAIKATDILYAKYGGITGLFKPCYTYLFEIIYPSNRIVVDYAEMEDLVLLAIIDIETGQEYNIHDPDFMKTCSGFFPIVRHYDGIKDIAQLKSLEEPNKEGFVLHFESGLRLKAKFAEYVRLHKLLTQCTARTIWELLRTDQPFDDLLNRVPDEFYAWVKRTRDDLLRQFKTIETEALASVEQVESLPTRKEQAAIVVREQYRGIIFLMLDGKDYHEAIWKLLYPPAERPFKIDEEVA